MPDPTANATVIVAEGSAAITWEVATILSEGLSRLGLRACVGRPETGAVGVPIIIFGYGATAPPPLSRAQARSAVIMLLGGPETQAFNSAAGLAEVAARWFAVSSRTAEALRARGVRAERFVLGYADRWDTGGASNKSKPIDVVYPGEVDGPGRRVLARVAVELAEMRSCIDLAAGRWEPSATVPAFESSALLADARLTLSLRCWGETTLDWAATVRAMCNGSVVIAEPAPGCGELVPGEHFLMSRTESIGPVVRAAIADPQALANMAATAYELCRTELDMDASLERLATAVGRSRVRLRMSQLRARPAVTSSRPQVGADAQRLKFEVVGPRREDLDPDVEVDLICVEHREAGPISLTRESLAGHQGRLNLHVGTVGAAEHGRELLSGRVAVPVGRSIAQVRNYLVRHSSAPLLMFINSGDEVLTGALSSLATALARAIESDIGVPILALGTADLVDSWPRNSSTGTSDSDAPQRGYMVRRAYLERVGPFVVGDGRAAGVDRAFWTSAAAVGGRVAVLPQVGVRLWHPTQVD